MPLLLIHSLPPADVHAFSRMLGDVRDSGAAALGYDPSNVWVMFSAVPPGSYLQGRSWRIRRRVRCALRTCGFTAAGAHETEAGELGFEPR